MKNNMIYCDLVIYSNEINCLPKNLFLTKAKKKIDYTNNFSPERVAQRLRWEKAGIRMRKTIERHWWTLSSKNSNSGDNLENHILWLLSHLRANTFLSTELDERYDYYISVFWGSSNGTGGGPLIKCDLMEILIKHKLELAIGFYVNG